MKKRGIRNELRWDDPSEGHPTRLFADKAERDPNVPSKFEVGLKATSLLLQAILWGFVFVMILMIMIAII